MKHFLNTKGNKTTYHQRNREKKMNPAKEYYKSNIIENYLTKKNIKREYGRNRY